MFSHLPEAWLSFRGSKPTSQPIGKSSSNGRVAANPFQDSKKSLPTIPFSDQPNTRRMIVLQEYKAVDNQGLTVQRGEQVQVLSQEGDWYYARNETKKQGFVPCSHLVLPYSATRTKKSHTHPIRPVASNSTIHEMEHVHQGGVPMYPSHSAGIPRPQDEFMNRANAFARRGSSPQVLAVNETCNNNNGTTNGMTVAMYEQKYSPSSSSGVASMNGPSSPSFQSLPENYSQDINGPHSSGSSVTQERTSLSSIEENGIEPPNGYHMQNGVGFEEPGMRSQRTNSESSLMHMQARPLPHPPPLPNHEGVYLDKRMQHIYSTITNGENPPPIPPRERPPALMSHSQPYPDSDEYIAPADAVLEQPGPHLDRPRVQSLSDVRAREGHRHVQSNVDYSEVFKGKKRSHRSNGYHHGNDTASEHSEGGSSNLSSRRGSGSRRAHDQITTSREVFPHEARPSLAHIPTQSTSTRVAKFRKCLWGVFVVIKTFESQDENELSVLEGEHVSVWNQDDQDWFWIVKHSTSDEGFVPSRFLKEVVASEVQPTSVSVQSHQLPPIPPKHHSNHTHSDTGQFRNRSHSQESSNQVNQTNQVNRNRGRLNSGGSSRSRSSLKANHSVTSIEKMEIPESPSTTPPPPYCEYEHTHSHQPAPTHPHQPAPTRHHSLSQHDGHSSQQGVVAQMHRTRSQGHVIRQRPHPPPPMQRFLSPPETYNLRSPTTSIDDGTLV
ncbi:uncharacterized protein LOC135337297 isoform X3 [Halichondria panicea]|uniref:uncharacterized protein LOC135337297 isoform X3 n=1 Tax=Halichondria panicea TaxID=6063 RepID=UPI00312B6396